jgi:hypothetical protein
MKVFHDHVFKDHNSFGQEEWKIIFENELYRDIFDTPEHAHDFLNNLKRE